MESRGIIPLLRSAVPITLIFFQKQAETFSIIIIFTAGLKVLFFGLKKRNLFYIYTS